MGFVFLVSYVVVILSVPSYILPIDAKTLLFVLFLVSKAAEENHKGTRVCRQA